MGVKLTDLLVRKNISFDSLKGKVVAVDASIFLYQFLTTIRQRDGSLLTDSKGRVTSHLIGLFSRTANFLSRGIKPVYVFDGKPPEFKHLTNNLRKKAKEEALKKYENAIEKGYLNEAKKFASRTSLLTKEMVDEAKKLLKFMGVPIVQAPSEGEAQASFVVKNGDAFAVASQDEDCLMFGSPRLVRNLSVTLKKKVKDKLVYQSTEPELIILSEVLSNLGISQDQLIVLGILVGTDYNPGGVKGIGPKKALALVKKFNDYDELFKSVNWSFDFSWRDVFDLIKNIDVSSDYSIEFGRVDSESVKSLLCDEHDFSIERVESTLKLVVKSTAQKGLSDFF